MSRRALLPFAAAFAAFVPVAAAGEPVMVQCGRQYQADRAAGTLNGMDWSRYRTECAACLKAATVPAPVAAAPPNAAASVPASVAAGPSAPALPVQPDDGAPRGGREAMHLRQKQCGAEWTAQKAALIAQTPGLTWPHYWSLCNTRLKAAGH